MGEEKGEGGEKEEERAVSLGKEKEEEGMARQWRWRRMEGKERNKDNG